MFVPILFRLVSVAAFPAAVSCSGSYQKDFRAAVASQPVEVVSPNGPWKGEWKSEVNGHHGPIWCMISPDGEDRHQFRYRAGWGVLQFGDYIHRTSTAAKDDGFTFSGDMELPGGAGRYQVRGIVTPESFDARYESKADRGTMKLTRP